MFQYRPMNPTIRRFAQRRRVSSSAASLAIGLSSAPMALPARCVVARSRVIGYADMILSLATRGWLNVSWHPTLEMARMMNSAMRLTNAAGLAKASSKTQFRSISNFPLDLQVALRTRDCGHSGVQCAVSGEFTSKDRGNLNRISLEAPNSCAQFKSFARSQESRPGRRKQR